MELFESIKVKDEHKKALKVLSDDLELANLAFYYATNMINTSKKKLFKCIAEKYPETKNFQINYDHRNAIITAIDIKEGE